MEMTQTASVMIQRFILLKKGQKNTTVNKSNDTKTVVRKKKKNKFKKTKDNRKQLLPQETSGENADEKSISFPDPRVKTYDRSSEND